MAASITISVDRAPQLTTRKERMTATTPVRLRDWLWAMTAVGHERALLLPAPKGYRTDTACPDSEKEQNDVLLEVFRETELNSIVVDGSAYNFTTLVNPFGPGDPSIW